MQFASQTLANLTKKPLFPIYWIHGDAWFLVEEARLAIRALAKAQGYSVTRSQLMDTDITWSALQETARQSSLFAECCMMDIELPKSALTAEGLAVLKNLCAHPSQETIYIFVLRSALDKKHLQTEWFKTLDAVGAIVSCIEPVGGAFISWLNQRIRHYEMTFDQDALNNLVEWTSGNLLAADQTLRGLQALDKKIVHKADVENIGMHDPRFATFALIDVARAGKKALMVQMIDTLHVQKIDAILVLWVLARECRQRLNFLESCAVGSAPQSVLKSLGIFPKHQGEFQKASERQSVKVYRLGLQLAAHIDSCIKGAEQGDVWMLLKDLGVMLS